MPIKQVKFFDHIRKAAGFNKGLVLPSGERTQRTWPVCMTCFKEVDSVDLKNVNSESADIVVKCCHVKGDTPDNIPMFEDSIRVKFPYRIDSNKPGDILEDEHVNFAIRRAMHDMCPFDPSTPSK